MIEPSNWSYYVKGQPVFTKPKRFILHKPESQEMTYILGSVCSDGVVLVADKKVTMGDGVAFDYQEKIYGDFHGVIFGAAGSVGIYELLRYQIQDLVQGSTSNPITKNNIIQRLSAILHGLYREYRNEGEYCRILVSLKEYGRYNKLILLNYNGIPRTITKYMQIGSGEPYGNLIMRKLWKRSMSMERVASLGYSAIKMIEKFELDNTVGVGRYKPTILYIPNNEDGDKEPGRNEWKTFKKNSDSFLENLNTVLRTSF